MERYRSGHNGADSKSVWAQAHVGSNPTLSAKQGGHPRKGVPALFGGDEAPLRTHRVSAPEAWKLSFHALLYSSPFLFVGREMAGSNARDKSRALRRIPNPWSLPFGREPGVAPARGHPVPVAWSSVARSIATRPALLAWGDTACENSPPDCFHVTNVESQTLGHSRRQRGRPPKAGEQTSRQNKTKRMQQSETRNCDAVPQRRYPR